MQGVRGMIRSVPVLEAEGFSSSLDAITEPWLLQQARSEGSRRRVGEMQRGREDDAFYLTPMSVHP